ncbi:outer membrane protein [Rhodobacter maris]|uniref:Outer membrane immunogenic protein n=1 Tax=Rhodobacter maris TaxID=446682 RepID=A0A285SX47_9RHOB|nr:porin family protein [Rhodobacter maris]SOC12838.1 outer membrane immunogenic protein [Rhodobacter maris]
MKKLGIAIAALAGLAAPAFAGGMNAPVMESTPIAAMPAPAAVNWQGFYAGATAGAATGGRSTYKFAGTESSDSFGSGSYGVFGGYNYQLDRMVYGGELALQATDYDLDNGGGHFNNMLDLKARVGRTYGARGEFLPYAFVGYSKGQWKNVSGLSNDDPDGVNYGLGVDYALTDKWVVGAEFIRRELDADYDGGNGKVENNFNSVAVRAAYRF